MWSETSRNGAQQPDGPYHLLGYSFGGLLAYETAHALTERGARIGTIMCLDVLAPQLMEAFAEFNSGVDRNTLTGQIIGAMLEGGVRYVPPPLDHCVHLVRARDDKVFTSIGDPTLGWSAASVRTQLHWVAGDHLSMMKRPGVTEVADIVHAVLAAPLPHKAMSR